MNEPHTAGKAWQFFWRALMLRCPLCGQKPIFVPLWKTRSLRDWFSPLDGCPRCGYAYEREPGYFLMAVWAVGYGFGSVLGIAIYVILEWFFDLPLWQLLAAVLVPVLLFNILFARHAKAFFIAVDHFFDPHEKDGGDDDGNKPRNPPPSRPSPPTDPKIPLGAKT